VVTYLECPCCGDDGAESDSAGYFYDCQPLICGCKGHVNVEEDDEPWVSVIDECPCGSGD
jgi:hypothetical protein